MNTTLAYIDVPLNSTTNLSEYRHPFNDTGIAIAASILIPLMVIGVIGNGLLLCALGTDKKLRNQPFMRIIISLCCSDLISSSISWIHLYRRTWGFDDFDPIPNFFCKVYWGGDLMTSFATALHILLFATARYISLRSINVMGVVRNKHITISIIIIWVSTFSIGAVPWYLMSGASVRDRTSGKPNARWPSCTINEESLEIYNVLQRITYPTFILAPAIGIIITSILIPLTVRLRTINLKNEEANARRRKKERQAVAQLILITSTFLLGYIPFIAYEYWGVQTYPETYYYHTLDYWFGFSAYMMLRLSECINPFVYILGSKQIYKRTNDFVKRTLFCCHLIQLKDAGQPNTIMTTVT